MIGQTTETAAASLLQPLQTQGRTREASVEAQIMRLLQCDAGTFWFRVRLADRAASDWVQEEALVGLLRIRNRQGDSDAAWHLAELLIERSAGFIERNLRPWRLTNAQAEDCIRDIQEQMLLDLFNDGRGAEFWEVRFWLCLKRRLLNFVQKYQKIADNEVAAFGGQDDEDNGENTLTRLADPRAVSPQQQAEIGEALALLTDKERAAFVLFYQHQWQQQQIADRLQVTDRTVRALLKKAEARLAQWRTASRL